MNPRIIFSAAFVLCCTLFVNTGAHAQLRVGGTLGLNFSSLNLSEDSPGEDYSGLAGIVIGAIVDYELNEKMGLRSGLVFIGKGANAELGAFQAKFRYTYLEIPILFRYFFPLSSTDLVVPYATAGPSVGFRTGAKGKTDDGGEFDLKDEVSGIDFGISFGAGVNVPLDDLVEGLVPFFEIRYSLGIANVNSEAADDPNEISVRNNGLLITIGATIPIGG